ncbi:2'-5' RNA ligase family protein [Pseudomonas sp. F1_0610]|uniref:2'-5' RNA ligase family protein n=1 Tax=Pseudomonas sp. F1_0610 TaxID=3114284 RepID=UPI0039C4BF35
MNQTNLQLKQFKQTECCLNRDYAEWHKGRKYYCVWCILIDQEDIVQRAKLAQQLLHPALHSQTQRQLHISLFINGFIGLEASYNDDISISCLQRQINDLEQLKLAPFSLIVTGLDSFASAAFLQVDASAELKLLRETLSSASEVRFQAYIPHITLGLYKLPLCQDQLLAYRNYLNTQTLTLNVRSISLCLYNASALFSSLEEIYRLELHPPNT